MPKDTLAFVGVVRYSRGSFGKDYFLELFLRKLRERNIREEGYRAKTRVW